MNTLKVVITPQPLQTLLTYLNDENNSYHLTIGMILKKSRVFLCHPFFYPAYPMAESFLNEQDSTPECEKEKVSRLDFPVNKQPDGSYLTNYHLFEQWMNPDPAI